MKSIFSKYGSVVALLAACALFSACTQNERARSFGGTATTHLPKGKKLINVTFKNNDIWLLTRDAKPGESFETYEFIEDSNLGIANGKVIIVESAK